MSRKQMSELIQQLSKKEYVTADELAGAFKVSVKTARIRVKELNDLLKKQGAAIESKSRYGYRLVIQDEALYSRWKETLLQPEDTVPETQEERVYYLMVYLLGRSASVRLDDLSDFMYVSKATLSGCLKQAELRFHQYGIQLERRPNHGIRALGSEFHIRRCMRDLYLKYPELGGAVKERTDKELKALADIVWNELHKYKIRLSEIAFENFIEDIYVAVRRMKWGHYIELSETEIRGIGDREWELIHELAGRLEERYELAYTRQEQLYMALHLAGKKMVGTGEKDEGNFVIHEDIDRMVIEMLDTVRRELQLDFSNNFELRMSLNQHMVPLDIRLRYDIPLENPLLDHIREKYTLAFAIAAQAATVLQGWYHKEIPEDEVGYFALIFALALEQQNKPVEKSDILIVCSSGKGSSRLLKYKYEREFKEYLGDVFICDLYELDTFDFEQVDYVFTTIPISKPIPRPIQEIGLFLEPRDVENVRKILEGGKLDFLAEYFKPQNFLTDIEGISREEVLQQICSHAVTADHLPPDLYESVIRRESMMATDFGDRVAIPHPSAVMTQQTYLYVAVLKRPVFWSREEVQIVILTVIGKQEDKQIQKLYAAVTNLISDEKSIDAILQSPGYETFMGQLKNQGIR